MAKAAKSSEKYRHQLMAWQWQRQWREKIMKMAAVWRRNSGGVGNSEISAASNEMNQQRRKSAIGSVA